VTKRFCLAFCVTKPIVCGVSWDKATLRRCSCDKAIARRFSCDIAAVRRFSCD